MLTAIKGTYRNGHITFAETPEYLPDEAEVIITFLTPATPSPAVKIVDSVRAAETRARLRTFAEDWDDPEMDVYDDYDANKAKLPRG